MKFELWFAGIAALMSVAIAAYASTNRAPTFAERWEAIGTPVDSPMLREGLERYGRAKAKTF